MFRIQADLTYHFPGPAEVLLMLEAARSPDQAVLTESLTITPAADIARLDDSVSGERRAVFTADGEVTISYRADVEAMWRDADLADAPQSAIHDLPGEALSFLRASRYCPSDRFMSFCARQFAGLTGGALVLAILDWIHGDIAYQAGVSDHMTTALDTFVDRAGVCRDFAHLAITLCRASNIPARAVSAYAWKLDPPDMHAVAEVYLGGRWRLIDATRLCPMDGLVRVATGRDAADIAFMTTFGQAHLISQSFCVVQAPTPQ